ncbi:diacylglycerol kinase family protein [uncultured Cellulomonas sp.]|uniref:diacylglycerol/lipid kinase family protein n=1 Tax=uncultured Cellulomonas sp. TaxID=189682 RepID=UPI00261AD214|nr:diacylglycerol kinase family protein [uncultured Cellulomonas sp.]
MTRLGVLVNPTAAGGRGARAGAATVDRLRRRGHDVRVLTRADTVTPGDRTHGLDAVVAVGGDGTVHAALALTAGTGVPLGIVPAGSGNDVARSLELPRGDVDGAVGRLEDALARGPRRVDAVRAGPPGAATARWYVGVLSCGFDAAVSARALTLRHPQGGARYVRAVAAELARFAPYGYRVTIDDGEVWQSAGTLVAVANAPRFGGGIRIAPDAALDDGLLDVVVAGPVTRRGIAALLPGAYAGRHVRHPAVRVLRGRRILVEADAGSGPAPPPAFADGEPLGPLALEVEVRAGALAVLA